MRPRRSPWPASGSAERAPASAREACMPSRGVKLFGLIGAGVLAGLGLGYGAGRRRARGPRPRRVRVPDPHLGPRTGRHMGATALVFLALVLFAGAAVSAYLYVKRS